VLGTPASAIPPKLIGTSGVLDTDWFGSTNMSGLPKNGSCWKRLLPTISWISSNTT
jgi:hypothetical protein